MTRFKVKASFLSTYTWEIDHSDVETREQAVLRAWENLALADMEPDSVLVARMTIDGVEMASESNPPYDFGPYGEPESIDQAVRRLKSLVSVLEEPRRQRHIPVEMESYARWLVRRLRR